jgi:GNAT superfamily N-acetyltransferase
MGEVSVSPSVSPAYPASTTQIQVTTPASDEAELLAEIHEAAAVAGYHHIFGDSVFPRDTVLWRWRSSSAIAFIADETGFAAVSPPWLDALYVRPEAWGTGIAGRLYDLAVAELRSRGVETAELWVLEDNDRARRFYERRGWIHDRVKRRASSPPKPIELHYALRLSTRSGAGPVRG